MEACEGCGLQIAGGTQGCQALFDQLRLRESTELATTYGSTRLTIDVYCLQHPDRYCVSAKSLAAHLTGVGWALERGGDESGLRALQRWLNGKVELSKPPVPRLRGEVTIADLASVEGSAAYAAAAERWARSTWAAYSSLHGVARGWIDQAVQRG
jgi:Family of unknown function (DUF5946)